MPLLRYFLFVGGGLLALLLVCSAVLPNFPSNEPMVSSSDHPAIRISSDRKWPERIVFDTGLASDKPVALAQVEAHPAARQAVSAAAAVHVREAMAQLQNPEAKDVKTVLADPKKMDIKPQPKRRVARARTSRPTMFAAQSSQGMLVAQQPHFGFFNMTW
jgi:hypothetical protein